MFFRLGPHQKLICLNGPNYWFCRSPIHNHQSPTTTTVAATATTRAAAPKRRGRRWNASPIMTPSFINNPNHRRIIKGNPIGTTEITKRRPRRRRGRKECRCQIGTMEITRRVMKTATTTIGISREGGGRGMIENAITESED